MVEYRTPNRKVLGSTPTGGTVLSKAKEFLYSLARHINSLQYWLMRRKRWLRPNMTEKLLTGTLNLNTNFNAEKNSLFTAWANFRNDGTRRITLS